MINAVMTHLQATAALQSHQGGQPLTEEQSQAESLLMAGEHTQTKCSSCARTHLTMPGPLCLPLPSQHCCKGLQVGPEHLNALLLPVAHQCSWKERSATLPAPTQPSAS